MTDNQIHFLEKFYARKISKEVFLQEFGRDIEDVNFIKMEIKKALESKNKESIERVIRLLWFQKNLESFIDEINELLIEPNHRYHQVITKKIQDLKNPKSIPYILKVLESNFDYLEYTASEPEVIAKWFSWALFSIGTKEAIEVIEEYSNSDNEGIKKEMRYRLDKIKNK